MANLMRKEVIYDSSVKVKLGLRFGEHNHQTGMMYTWEVKEIIGRELIQGISKAKHRYRWFVRAELVREEKYDQYLSRTKWTKKKYVYEAMGQKDLENIRYKALQVGNVEIVAEIEKHMQPHVVAHLKALESGKYQQPESALKTWLTFFRIIIFGK